MRLPLTLKEQTIIKLYYFDQLSTKQIAKQFGITANRVGQIRCVALAKINRGNKPLVRPTIAEISKINIDKLLED